MKYISYGTNLFTNKSLSTDSVVGWAWSIGNNKIASTKDLSFNITTTGELKITLTARDILDKEYSKSKLYNVIPAAPKILDKSLSNAVVGEEYSQFIHTATAAEPLRYYAYNLPSWAHLDVTTGEIVGTCSEPSSNNITIKVQDSIGRVVTKVFAFTSVCPVFTPTPEFTWETENIEEVKIETENLPDASFQTPYSMQFTAVPGSGVSPYGWVADNLPQGLSLDPLTGLLSGEITSSELTYSFEVTVTDSLGFQDVKQFTLNHDIPAPIVAPYTLPVTEYKHTYDLSPFNVSGAGPFIYESVSLPPGLSLDMATGEITGTSTGTSSQYDWIIKITDRIGQTTTVEKLVDNHYTAPVITERLVSDYQTINYGNPYHFAVHRTGGVAPFTWNATLSPGLSIDSTSGIISGTPSGSDESYLWTIEVVDANGTTDSVSFDMHTDWDDVIIETTDLPSTSYGTYYETQVTLTSGETPIAWAIAGAAPGLIIDNAGLISGTPTGPEESYDVVVTATDSRGNSDTLAVTVPNTYNPPKIVPFTAGTAYYGNPYDLGISITGGTGPFVWNISGLPNGLTNTDGHITGSAVAVEGSYPINVLVTDSVGLSDNTSFVIDVIKNVPQIILPDPAPITEYGNNFSLTLVVAHGTAPFIWSVDNLTPGLVLDSSTGIITGTVTGTDANYDWTISVVDAANLSDNDSLSVSNTVAPPSINQTEVLNVEINKPYSDQLTSDTGALPLTWSATGLPNGITIDNNGLISGTTVDPAGTYTWTVTVIDAIGQTDVVDYTDVELVNTAPLIEETSVPDVELNTAYSYTMHTVAGTGTAPFTWTSGTLPDGLTLDADGTLHGTVTTPFNDTVVQFKVTGNDGNYSVKDINVGVVEIAPTVDFNDGVPDVDLSGTNPEEPIVDLDADGIPENKVTNLTPAAPSVDYEFAGSGESDNGDATPVEPELDMAFTEVGESEGSDAAPVEPELDITFTEVGESDSGDQVITPPVLIFDFNTIDDLPITVL